MLNVGSFRRQTRAGENGTNAEVGGRTSTYTAPHDYCEPNERSTADDYAVPDQYGVPDGYSVPDNYTTLSVQSDIATVHNNKPSKDKTVQNLGEGKPIGVCIYFQM